MTKLTLVEIRQFKFDTNAIKFKVMEALKELFPNDIPWVEIFRDLKDDPGFGFELNQWKNFKNGAMDKKCPRGDRTHYLVLVYWLYKGTTKFATKEQCIAVANQICIDRFAGSLDEYYETHVKNLTSTPLTALQQSSKPTAPFIWPKYVLKSKAEAAEKELSKGGGESIWLNPYNHHSIPFVGRDAEIELLDDFIRTDGNFLTTYVIAPSGAGKTRLVSQWMRKYVADPDDTEGLEEKITGWDAGLVENRDAKSWKDWQPQCKTLIVIDYTYNYDEVIKAIADKATENHNQIIRLLILDHVKPKNMSGDVAYGKATGDSRSRGALGDFIGLEHKTINLTPDKNSTEVLSKIIARVATLFSSSAEDQPSDTSIQNATDALLAMGGDNTAKASQESETRNTATQHPLFAALMGQALGLNPDGDVTEFKRRDLIDQYFNVDHRIPWVESKKNAYWNNLGAWIGCYISVATLLRGAEFDRLHKHLPTKFDGSLNKPEAANIISQISGRLVANEDRHVLKPFEPDILGETFFLKFLDGCKLRDDVMGKFYKMLGTFKTPEHEDEAVSNFLESIKRLVRNLVNDDQDLDFIQRSWSNLLSFIDPKNFRNGSIIREVICISIGDIILQLNAIEKKNEISNSLIDLISFDSILKCFDLGFRDVCLRPFIYKIEKNKNRNFDNSFYEILKFYEHNKCLFDKPMSIMCAEEGCTKSLDYIYKCTSDDINKASNEYGHNVLAIAITKNNTELLHYLLSQKRIFIDHRNVIGGETSLIIAIRYENIPVVSALLENKANPNLKVSSIKPEYISLMAGIGPLDNIPLEGTTPLMVACTSGNEELVKILLANRAHVNQQSSNVYYVNAFSTAACHGHLDILKLLIKNGANPFVKNAESIFDAADRAVNGGHIDIVEYLGERFYGRQYFRKVAVRDRGFYPFSPEFKKFMREYALYLKS
ncbi:MAG: ankyrin repeat domain-containing protein [Mariprofundaceae bacterium]|nr:ankyrin repeat domain-containing protein [Mariprofundaceae bacterium]